MEESEKIAYDKAKRKVKEIKGFYINLTCYLIVLPIIIYVNLTYTPEFQWFWFSMLGWGIGVISHGMGAFGYYPFLGRDWEERKLKELMDKMNKIEEQRTKFE
ncbi:2TM domain-containing protein [Flavobacterium cerinum]|uniref:2TM domain-containing protein n=1 Tax=Flavobacterium cerinum TaxID=2502784 RepID=A0A3S3QFB4_9FLAO|nr:2TM domain-containing protein [Flavobacterium cerinum]RWW92034.1 2TM domain-containing protein [Flavobacterium cerinum]